MPSLPIPGPDQLVSPVSTLLGYLGKEASARRGRARRALDEERVRAAEAITDALSVLGTGVADKPEPTWDQQGREFADLLLAFDASPNRRWWRRR